MMESETTSPVSPQQVVEAIANLLVRMLRLDVPVTGQSKLMEELDLTSSQSTQLVLDLERDLSIMIDVEDFDQDELVTVDDLAQYIATHSMPQ